MNYMKQVAEMLGVEIGEEFDGVITRVEDYGGFVKLFGDKEGLLHISRFSNDYVKNAADVMRVGDTIKVKVIEIDDKGKIKLSHKEFTKPAKKEGEKKLEAKKEFKKEPFKGVADDDGFVEVKKEEPKAEVKEEKKKFSFFKKK